MTANRYLRRGPKTPRLFRTDKTMTVAVRAHQRLRRTLSAKSFTVTAGFPQGTIAMSSYLTPRLIGTKVAQRVGQQNVNKIAELRRCRREMGHRKSGPTSMYLLAYLKKYS